MLNAEDFKNVNIDGIISAASCVALHVDLSSLSDELKIQIAKEFCTDLYLEDYIEDCELYIVLPIMWHSGTTPTNAFIFCSELMPIHQRRENDPDPYYNLEIDALEEAANEFIKGNYSFFDNSPLCRLLISDPQLEFYCKLTVQIRPITEIL